MSVSVPFLKGCLRFYFAFYIVRESVEEIEAGKLFYVVYGLYIVLHIARASVVGVYEGYASRFWQIGGYNQLVKG